MNWVLAEDKLLKGHAKLILVNGSVLAQEKKFKKICLFDQEGKLTTRFWIKHVPAVVMQEGSMLKITEAKP